MYGNPYVYGYGARSAGLGAVGPILALLLALTGTILLMILVTPEKRRAGLNKFFRGIADICNFKGLLLEYIVKATYIFNTLFVILAGFFALFDNALAGFLLMLLGPIVLRILYEFTMMFILLVKNVIQINNKMPGKAADPMKIEAAPDVAPAPAPVAPKMVFCAHCGTQYDANKGGCPNGCKN